MIGRSADHIMMDILSRFKLQMEDLDVHDRVQLPLAVVQALSVAAHHHHKLEDQRYVQALAD